MNSSLIDKIKKINELKLRGENGEAVNASELLQKLMKKYKITQEMLDDLKIDDYFLTIDETHGYCVTLLNQIVKLYNQNNQTQIKAYYVSFDSPLRKDKMLKEFIGKHNAFLTCTIGEFLEINAMYSHYSDAYIKSLNVHYISFCMANNLLIKSKETDSEVNNTYVDNYKKAMLQSMTIDETPFTKRIKQ